MNEEIYGAYVEGLDGAKIHPVQFDELYARVTYERLRMERVPWYHYAIPLASEEKPVQLSCLPLAGLDGAPVLRKRDPEEYARLLAFHWARWGYELEDVFAPPNRVASYMIDSGNLLLLDREGREVEMRPMSHGDGGTRGS